MDAPPIPFFDLKRQYSGLKPDFMRMVEAIADSQTFILGPIGRELEAEVASYCQCRFGIGCASGSDALRLALMALKIQPGDEVIVPSFTFYATAGSVTAVNAIPRFCDVRPDTFNMDPASIERRLSLKTRAIIVVHLYGQSADMDAILALARPRGIPVIEDAAQAIGAEWNGKRVGSMGEIGCLSFYPTKNLGGAGDGGMLVTQSESLGEKLRRLRVHGESKKYFYSELGINSRLDELQAAMIRIKLQWLEGYHAARILRAERYLKELEGIRGLTLPARDARGRHVFNQFTITTPERDRLQEHLTRKGVGSFVYYPYPLHSQPCFQEVARAEDECPVTERLCREVLSLPIFPELTAEEQSRVIEAVRRFFVQ